MPLLLYPQMLTLIANHSRDVRGDKVKKIPLFFSKCSFHFHFVENIIIKKFKSQRNAVNMFYFKKGGKKSRMEKEVKYICFYKRRLPILPKNCNSKMGRAPQGCYVRLQNTNQKGRILSKKTIYHCSSPRKKFPSQIPHTSTIKSKEDNGIL